MSVITSYIKSIKICILVLIRLLMVSEIPILNFREEMPNVTYKVCILLDKILRQTKVINHKNKITCNTIFLFIKFTDAYKN